MGCDAEYAKRDVEPKHSLLSKDIGLNHWSLPPGIQDATSGINKQRVTTG
jgi:hypothetical protein